MSSKVRLIVFETRTEMHRCTMKLRSRQYTSIHFTSSEKLHPLKLIMYFLKTSTKRHFFQQLKIIQCLLYQLFKVEQRDSDLIKCRRKKTIIREYKWRYRDHEVLLKQPSSGTLIVKRLETKLILSTLYTSGLKVNMSKLYTSRLKVKNVNIIHKWLKG